MYEINKELAAAVLAGRVSFLVVGPGYLGFGPRELQELHERLSPSLREPIDIVVFLEDSRKATPFEPPAFDAAFLERLVVADSQSSQDEESVEEAERRCNHWWKRSQRRLPWQRR